MPREEDGEKYLNAKEAAEILGITKQLFSANVQPFLEKHFLPGRKRPFYKPEDVNVWKNKPEEAQIPILIQGITKNFEKEMKRRGIDLVVKNIGTPEVVVMNERMAHIFRMPVGTPVIKRGRLRTMQNTPVGMVCNWYRRDLADDELLEEMRRNDSADMPALMQEKYGVALSWCVESVKTRAATQEERQILKMAKPGDVFEIQRVNLTQENGETVMVSDLTLITQYFNLEYSYPTRHWIEEHREKM